MLPTLHVEPDGQYEARARSRTSADYERLGILPRAFYLILPNVIYTSQSAFDAAARKDGWALRLLAHELGHARGLPNHEHPTAVFAGFQHAWQVGFDVRAYSGVYRWRRGNSEWWGEFERWFAGQVAILGKKPDG